METEQIVQYNNNRASFVQVSKSQHESAFISHLKSNISVKGIQELLFKATDPIRAAGVKHGLKGFSDL